MKLISPHEFEEQGGLTIGIGAKTCLYTLRTEYWDTIGVFVADGLPKESRPIRRSHHLQNLGKDWTEVAARLPEILAAKGYADDEALYVPGYIEGKLDPNKSPDQKYIPTEEIPFGKYCGQTITELRGKDMDYLLYLGENYQPNEERKNGRWMAFMRDQLAPELGERAKQREAEKAVREQEASAARARCAPLAKFLHGQSKRPDDFANNMAKHFDLGGTVEQLAPRAAHIVGEMWCKSHGGRCGSKAFNDAAVDFDQQFLTPESLQAVLPAPVPGALEASAQALQTAAVASADVVRDSPTPTV